MTSVSLPSTWRCLGAVQAAARPKSAGTTTIAAVRTQAAAGTSAGLHASPGVLVSAERSLYAFSSRGPQWGRHRPSPVLCAVSGGPKSPPSGQKTLVLRVDDPLAGRPYRPPQPGDEPDFWEGPKWDLLGFVTEYLWAIGIVLAVAASAYAVVNYSTEEPAPTGTAPVEVEEASPPAAGVDSILDYPEVDDAPPL